MEKKKRERQIKKVTRNELRKQRVNIGRVTYETKKKKMGEKDTTTQMCGMNNEGENQLSKQSVHFWIRDNFCLFCMCVCVWIHDK